MAKEVKDNYKDWAALHKLSKTKGARKHFDKVEEVRKKYNQAKTARENNCYWSSYTDTGTGSSSGGGGWSERWDKQEKARLQWAKAPSGDDFVSNVKSPMIAGRIYAFVNQFKKLNLGWMARPNNEDDKNAAKVAEKALDYWFQNTTAKAELVKVADEAATHGSALFKVSYVKKQREYRFPKTDDFTKEEKEELEKEKKTIYGKKEKVTAYEDVTLEVIPLREYYPDPQARCQHGASYEARYGIRRRFIQLDDFKAEYGANPNAKNVDKVVSTHSYKENDYDFFHPPEEVIEQDTVEVLEYENQLTDEYIVIANDLLIIDTPLPYNHKELSIHKVDFIKNPTQYYGIGIADLLMNLAGAEEILTNMAYDYIYRTYNKRYFIDATNFGELSEEMIRTDNQLIPIDLSDGKAINHKIQELPNQPIGFDLFKMYDITERNATIASQIDPSQLSLIQTGTTATSSVLNKEQIESMIGGVIDNFINEGFLTAGRQVWKLIQQFWSIPKVEKIIGKDKEEKLSKKFRTIRLEGIQLDINPDTKELETTEKEGYSFFELSDEFLSTTGEIDISIRPDSLEVISKGLEMQKWKENFAQLINFAVDPDNTQAMQQHPLPMINAPKLFQQYIDIEGLPEDILMKPEANEDLQLEKAEEHVMEILQGKRVPGTPGAGEAHRRYEAKVLLAIDSQLNRLAEQIEEDMEKQKEELLAQQGEIPMVDEFTGSPLPLPEPQPDPAMLKKLEELKDVQSRLSEHLAVENMPADMIEETALETAQPSAPPPPPGMGAPMPGGAGPVPMPQGPGIQDVMPGFGGAPV